MRHGTIIFPAAVLAGFLLPSAAAAQEVELSTEGLAYLLEATAASHAQVEVNRLAAEAAGDEALREDAQALLDAYTERHAALSDLAQAYGVEPIREVDPASAHLLGVLQGLEGPAFDAAYVAGIASAMYGEEFTHRRAVEQVGERDIREAAAAAVAPTDASFDAAMLEALEREGDLPDGVHPWDGTALVFGMNIDNAQIELGQVVVERAEDEAVRAFAERMVAEHAPSHERGAALAAERGIPPVEEQGPVEARVFAILSELPQPDFDREYINSQVIFHDHWYKRLEFAANNARDEAVRAHATQGRDGGRAHHDDVYAIVADYVEGNSTHEH